MLGFANLALQRRFPLKNQHQSRGIARQPNSLINQSPLALIENGNPQVPVVDWHCMFSPVFIFYDNPGCLILLDEIRTGI